ncbi:hypothetical protein AB0I22_35630 [Streptomyces sp. NPDC050610]|uniref:DUF7683 domain-containing protein n=1 Tax=Streptomyces sp. NPDC050610 TaxID=3157097 RepID=UPI003445B491
MKFIVASYKKDSDSPDHETDISEVGAEVLAGILGVPTSTLSDVYPLDESHTAALGQLTGTVFDLENHEYFLHVVDA